MPPFYAEDDDGCVVPVAMTAAADGSPILVALETPEGHVAAVGKRIRRKVNRPNVPGDRERFNYHDPGTGRFAPQGFVTPTCLRGLNSDNAKLRDDVRTELRDKIDGHPGLLTEYARALKSGDKNKAAALAKQLRQLVLGDRPTGSAPDDVLDRNGWDAGSRDLSKMLGPAVEYAIKSGGAPPAPRQPDLAAPARPSTPDPLVDAFQLADWETLKPWNATRDPNSSDPNALLLNGEPAPRWLRIGPGRGTEAASHMDDHIRITPAFLDLPNEDVKRSALYHEAGHGLSDRMLEDQTAFDLVNDLPSFGHLNGQTTPGEVAAEAYSILWSEPSFLDQHAPGIRDAIISKADEYGYPLPDGMERPAAPEAPGAPAAVEKLRLPATDIQVGDKVSSPRWSKGQHTVTAVEPVDRNGDIVGNTLTFDDGQQVFAHRDRLVDVERTPSAGPPQENGPEVVPPADTPEVPDVMGGDVDKGSFPGPGDDTYFLSWAPDTQEWAMSWSSANPDGEVQQTTGKFPEDADPADVARRLAETAGWPAPEVPEVVEPEARLFRQLEADGRIEHADSLRAFFDDEDPMDAVATHFDLDTVTMQDIEEGRALIRARSQEWLDTEFPDSDTITVYRGGPWRDYVPFVNVTLKRQTAQNFAETRNEDVREFQVNKDDVAYAAEAFPLIRDLSFQERELGVDQAALADVTPDQPSPEVPETPQAADLTPATPDAIRTAAQKNGKVRAQVGDPGRMTRFGRGDTLEVGYIDDAYGYTWVTGANGKNRKMRVRWDRLDAMSPVSDDGRRFASTRDVERAAFDADGPIVARVADGRLWRLGFQRGDSIQVEYKNPHHAVVTAPGKDGKPRTWAVRWDRLDALDGEATTTPNPRLDLGRPQPKKRAPASGANRAAKKARLEALAAEHDLTYEEVRDAERDLGRLRREMRTEAASAANDAFGQLDAADALLLPRVPKKYRTTDASGRTRWTRGTGGEWDWWDQLSVPEQRRIERKWMQPAGSTGDESLDGVWARVASAANINEDEAQAWWLDRSRLHDAAAGLAKGREASGTGGVNLDAIAPTLEADGTPLSLFVGHDTDTAIVNVARAKRDGLEAATAEEADEAFAILGRDATDLPEAEQPWAMPRAAWRAEVDALLARVNDETLTDDEFNRIEALLPIGVVNLLPDDATHDELYDELLTTARRAGYTNIADPGGGPTTPPEPDTPEPPVEPVDDTTNPDSDAWQERRKEVELSVVNNKWNAATIQEAADFYAAASAAKPDDEFLADRAARFQARVDAIPEGGYIDPFARDADGNFALNTDSAINLDMGWRDFLNERTATAENDLEDEAAHFAALEAFDWLYDQAAKAGDDATISEYGSTPIPIVTWARAKKIKYESRRSRLQGRAQFVRDAAAEREAVLASIDTDRPVAEVVPDALGDVTPDTFINPDSFTGYQVDIADGAVDKWFENIDAVIADKTAKMRTPEEIADPGYERWDIPKVRAAGGEDYTERDATADEIAFLGMFPGFTPTEPASQQLATHSPDEVRDIIRDEFNKFVTVASHHQPNAEGVRSTVMAAVLKRLGIADDTEGRYGLYLNASAFPEGAVITNTPLAVSQWNQDYLKTKVEAARHLLEGWPTQAVLDGTDNDTLKALATKDIRVGEGYDAPTVPFNDLTPTQQAYILLHGAFARLESPDDDPPVPAILDAIEASYDDTYTGVINGATWKNAIAAKAGVDPSKVPTVDSWTAAALMVDDTVELDLRPGEAEAITRIRAAGQPIVAHVTAADARLVTFPKFDDEPDADLTLERARTAAPIVTQAIDDLEATVLPMRLALRDAMRAVAPKKREFDRKYPPQSEEEGWGVTRQIAWDNPASDGVDLGGGAFGKLAYDEDNNIIGFAVTSAAGRTKTILHSDAATYVELDKNIPRRLLQMRRSRDQLQALVDNPDHDAHRDQLADRYAETVTPALLADVAAQATWDPRSDKDIALFDGTTVDWSTATTTAITYQRAGRTPDPVTEITFADGNKVWATVERGREVRFHVIRPDDDDQGLWFVGAFDLPFQAYKDDHPAHGLYQSLTALGGEVRTWDDANSKQLDTTAVHALQDVGGQSPRTARLDALDELDLWERPVDPDAYIADVDVDDGHPHLQFARRVLASMPVELLDRVGPVSISHVDTKAFTGDKGDPVTRAYYSPLNATIHIEPNSSESTILHELFHHLEKDSSLNSTLWAYYVSRTGNETPAELGAGMSGEYAREDHFLDSYSGKTYGQRKDRRMLRSDKNGFEFFTQGAEAVFGGNSSADVDQQAAVLGALANAFATRGDTPVDLPPVPEGGDVHAVAAPGAPITPPDTPDAVMMDPMPYDLRPDVDPNLTFDDWDWDAVEPGVQARLASLDGAPERRLALRVPIEAVGDILTRERFRTQHETGTSRGDFDPSFRREVEARGWGTPVDIADTERPVYGYLDDYPSRVTTQQYGDIVFHPRPQVAGRATVTLGDSHQSAADGLIRPLPVTKLTGAPSTRLMQAAGSDWAALKDYWEVQYHGGLTLDDLEPVIDYSPQTWPSPEYVQQEVRRLAEGIGGDVPVDFTIHVTRPSDWGPNGKPLTPAQQETYDAMRRLLDDLQTDPELEDIAITLFDPTAPSTEIDSPDTAPVPVADDGGD